MYLKVAKKVNPKSTHHKKKKKRIWDYYMNKLKDQRNIPTLNSHTCEKLEHEKVALFISGGL